MEPRAAAHMPAPFPPPPFPTLRPRPLLSPVVAEERDHARPHGPEPTKKTHTP